MVTTRRRGSVTLVVLLCVLLTGLGPATTIAQSQVQVAGPFREYYDRHNGAFVLGNPLTGLMRVNGYPAQYFERGRLEDHRGSTSDPTWAFTYGNLVSELTSCDPYGAVMGTNWTYGQPQGRTYFVGTLQQARDPGLRSAPPAGFTGGTAPVPGGIFVPFDAASKLAPGYTVPQYFWDYINRRDLFPGGWMHDIGLPLTNEVSSFTFSDSGVVGHIPIKVQAFERAVLVYQPKNPPDTRVWRANVGEDAVRQLPQPRTPGIEVPSAGARVTLPLHVLARVGSPCQQVKVTVTFQRGARMVRHYTLRKGEDGKGLLVESIDWATGDGSAAPRGTQNATLEIATSAGKVLARRSITILSATDPGTQEITLYWWSGENLTPVKRRIPRTSRIATATLEQMLWGPGPSEQGVSSAIPDTWQIMSNRMWNLDWRPKVYLHNLTIVNGKAVPDFSDEIHAYGGGSAWSGAIRRQIAQTLEQFPTVREVVIAVDGRTEGVLQP